MWGVGFRDRLHLIDRRVRGYRRLVAADAEFPPRNVMCAGAVVLADESCLLVREAQGRLAGQWGIPWGFVEQGEAPDDAAVRETLEEAGVVVEVTALLGTASLRNPAGAMGIVFLAELSPPDQVPHPDGMETSEVRFFDLAGLDDTTIDFEPWCRWVVQRVLKGRRGTPRTFDGPSPLPTFL